MKTKSTAAGIAMAVEAAGLLMSPEVAAELARLRAGAVPLAEDRFAEIRSVDLLALVGERAAGQISGYLADLLAEVDRLRTERHSTNEALSEAAESIRAKDSRIAELEQMLAVRTFYLADSDGAEGGPTLHTTHVAAIAWCDEVEPGEWYEDDGLWVQCDTDPDTDRPTTRGAGTVTPLTVQGDGIVAEAERIRQELVKAGAKVPVLTEVRDSQRDEIRRLQTEQGEVMKALGCDGAEEWDDVVYRARQLAARGVAPKPDVVLPAKFITDAMANVPDSLPGGEPQ